MRTFATLAIAASLAVPMTLGGAPLAHAVGEGPTPYDVPMRLHIQAPPSYPQWAETYAAKVPSNWGRASVVLPKGLATGIGVNAANASGAGYCTPDAAEGGWTGPAADRQGYIDANCRVNRNTVFLNMATVAAPSDSAAWEFRGETRTLRWRVSTTSACQDGAFRARNVRYGIREYEFPGEDLGPQGSYICFAQSILVSADYYAGGAIRTDSYAYNVRGNWSVFKVVGLGEVAKATNLRATQATSTSARVSWDFLPGERAGSPTSLVLGDARLTVTSTPDARSCQVRRRESCTVRNLRTGVPYTFTVKTTSGLSTITAGPTQPLTLTADAVASATPSPTRTASAAPSASASASATPTRSASPSASASAGAGSAQNASSTVVPLTPQVRVRDNSPRPRAGTTVDIVSMVTGQLRAGESVGQRELQYCYAATLAGPCTTAGVIVALPLNLTRAITAVDIPASAANGFIRVSQMIAVSPGPGLIGGLKVSDSSTLRVLAPR